MGFKSPADRPGTGTSPQNLEVSPKNINYLIILAYFPQLLTLCCCLLLFGNTATVVKGSIPFGLMSFPVLVPGLVCFVVVGRKHHLFLVFYLHFVICGTLSVALGSILTISSTVNNFLFPPESKNISKHLLSATGRNASSPDSLDGVILRI